MSRLLMPSIAPLRSSSSATASSSSLPRRPPHDRDRADVPATRVRIHAAARRRVSPGDADDVRRHLDREARRAMQRQRQTIMKFPEVASVHGKAGRAETAADPARLDMIESVITLRPRDEWPTRHAHRWCAVLRLRGSSGHSGPCGLRNGRGRWRSCRATSTRSSARRGINSPSRHPSGRASTRVDDGVARACRYQGVRRGPE